MDKGKKRKTKTGGRPARATKSERRKEVAERLGVKVSGLQGSLIKAGNVTDAQLKKGVQLQKRGSKYYAKISGTDVEVEISQQSFAGRKRQVNRLRDEEGKFITNAEDTRFKKAAKNMGAEDAQKFVNENIDRLREYPHTYELTLHIGSAMKTIVSYSDYKIFIDGKRATLSRAIAFLFDVNRIIDESSAGSTPSIFVTFKINENKKTLKIEYNASSEETED